MRTLPLLLLLPLATSVSCTEYDLLPETKDDFDTGYYEEEVELPVAECSVTPSTVAPPFESAEWSGESSYDPTGGTLVEYDWYLVSQPAGSAVSMPEGEAVRSGFVPDLAGTYEAQLIVMNDAGVESEPCTATLEAVPVENLWVEMYWAHDLDDMDLHLLAPGGTVETRTDCYYDNCVDNDTTHNLNWGDMNSFDDDPSLDLDDIPGTGPENINIQSPESGVFTVLVHDYKQTHQYQPENDVTVNVYLDGELLWSDTRAIAGEDTYTRFAEIDWENGEITGL